MSGIEYRFTSGALRFDHATTHVMGVVNVSPESKNLDAFSPHPAQTRAMGERYRQAGATIIDLGAQSSHFDNAELDPDVEIDRLLPHLAVLVEDGHLVSVDTWKPAVAAAAIEGGVSIINDTGGSRDQMLEAVAGADVGLVTMYLEGLSPLMIGEATMTEEKAEVTRDQLAEQLKALQAAGIRYPITDPGIGISYRSDYTEYTHQQLRVIRGLPLLRRLGPPVLVPVPRKSEFARVAAFIALSLEYGADIIRVHDVEAACDLVRLFGREPT